MVDLGDLLFIKSQKGVLRWIPKKMKLNEMGQEVTTSEGHKNVMVWKIVGQPHQRVANDIDSRPEAFMIANNMVTQNISANIDLLT